MDAVVCCLFACCVWVNKVQVYHVHARTSRPKCFQNTSQCILINNINTLLYVFSDSFRIHNRHIVIMIFLSYFRSIWNDHNTILVIHWQRIVRHCEEAIKCWNRCYLFSVQRERKVWIIQLVHFKFTCWIINWCTFNSLLVGMNSCWNLS